MGEYGRSSSRSNGSRMANRIIWHLCERYGIIQSWGCLGIIHRITELDSVLQIFNLFTLVGMRRPWILRKDTLGVPLPSRCVSFVAFHAILKQTKFCQSLITLLYMFREPEELNKLKIKGHESHSPLLRRANTCMDSEAIQESLYLQEQSTWAKYISRCPYTWHTLSECKILSLASHSPSKHFA
jgi:hypothetical protein